MWTLLLPLLGCSQRNSPTPPDAETPTANGLRPSVEQRSPNADGQIAAFEGQTRAPQPAGPSRFSIETIARGLGLPWAIEFLPDGRMLVTERSVPALRTVSLDGTIGRPVTGLPEIVVRGQGGILDVALAPDFVDSRTIYLSYAEARGDGRTNGTTVARARLDDAATALSDLEVIFRQRPARDSSHHFGSRFVFAPDGNLFVTLGERGSASELAQDPSNHIGSVVRIAPDGSVPDDNPFVDDPTKAPEVWSYGHRNLQSATLDLEGRLWTVEHGPKGGDELNQPQAGKNYGWPVISYGENYNGSPIGDGITAQEGLEQPVYYWDPVIAPSGMDVYTGEPFPAWEGDLLVGGLRAEAVVRLQLRNGRVHTEEWLDIGGRARDVKVGPDGYVYVAMDNEGTILRLVPSGS